MFHLPILAQAEERTKFIAFIVVNALIAAMSVITFGLTGVYNDCNNPDYQKYNLVTFCKQVNQPSVGYFVMCGIFTFLYSAFSLFILLDDRFLIGNKNITLRILVLGSIFIFAYNFALATAASLGVTTWNKQVEQLSKKSGWVLIGPIKLLVDFLTAFAILQFVINLPCIIITYFYWNQCLYIETKDKVKIIAEGKSTMQLESPLPKQ